jgi:hypothetical protein
MPYLIFLKEIIGLMRPNPVSCSAKIDGEASREQ